MNYLRTNFRTDLLGIDNSKKSGAGLVDVCGVRVRFLDHLGSPSQSRNTLEDEDENENNLEIPASTLYYCTVLPSISVS
jgi:hypothetical protein